MRQEQYKCVCCLSCFGLPFSVVRTVFTVLRHKIQETVGHLVSYASFGKKQGEIGSNQLYGIMTLLSQFNFQRF